MVSRHDKQFMVRAIELAARGQGSVEPNPMVGCVVVQWNEGHEPRIIAEGWHQQYGGEHAEIVALRQAGSSSSGAAMYVSLEPCCHQGKTPPCTQAIIDAGISRVVVGHLDPFTQVAGRGIQQLKDAGIKVEVGLQESSAKRLNAPYLKLIRSGRPWVIAKWAMTLDGKIATRESHSQWISNERSRGISHQLRGRVDAIIVGRRTVEQDDPLLTARPAGPRVATRVVLDSRGSLSSDSQLMRTARQVPVLVAVSHLANPADKDRLQSAGCEVVVCNGDDAPARLMPLLDHLGRRQMTNILVEGGSRVLGSFWDADAIDEVHVFVAPKLVGGKDAPSPMQGRGIAKVPELANVEDFIVEQIGSDLYVHGVVGRELAAARDTGG